MKGGWVARTNHTLGRTPPAVYDVQYLLVYYLDLICITFPITGGCHFVVIIC